MFLHSRNWFFPFSILYSKFKVVFLEGEFDEGKKVIDKYWVVYTKSAWRDFDYNQQKQNWIRWAAKTKILYVYNDEYREQQNMEENYIGQHWVMQQHTRKNREAFEQSFQWNWMRRGDSNLF